MATVAAAIDSVASKSVPASLWWYSFRNILRDIVASVAVGENHHTESAESRDLAFRLGACNNWFSTPFELFKPPNSSSRNALNSPNVDIGSHCLKIDKNKKEFALAASSHLNLDEVQTYMLVLRSCDSEADASQHSTQNRFDSIFAYYLSERQSLLKCVQFLVSINGMNTLQSDLSQKVSEVCAGLDPVRFLCIPVIPVKQEGSLRDFWAEGVCLELILGLDVAFLLTQGTSCDSKQFLTLFNLVSERFLGGMNSFLLSQKSYSLVGEIKRRAAFFLISFLNLPGVPTLLEATPHNFREVRSQFLVFDPSVQPLLGSLDPLDPQLSPLFLAWAVFFMLGSQLEQNSADKAKFSSLSQLIQSAMDSNVLNSMLQFVQSEISEVPEYRTVVKDLILGLLCIVESRDSTDEDPSTASLLFLLKSTVQGQDRLCVDLITRPGPVKRHLERVSRLFPFRIVPFLRLLSSVSGGKLSSVHVFKILVQESNITSLFSVEQHPGYSHSVDPASLVGDTFQCPQDLLLPRTAGLLIPKGAEGEVLEMWGSQLALVSWKVGHARLAVVLGTLQYHVAALQEPGTAVLSEQAAVQAWCEVGETIGLLSEIVSQELLVLDRLLRFGDSDSVQTARLSKRMAGNLCLDVVPALCAVARLCLEAGCADVQLLSQCVALLAAVGAFLPASLLTLDRSLSLDGSTPDDYCVFPFSAQAFASVLVEREAVQGSFPVTRAVLQLVAVHVAHSLAFHSSGPFSLIQYCVEQILPRFESWHYTNPAEKWEIAQKMFDLVKALLPPIPTPAPNQSAPATSDSTLRQTLLESLLSDSACFGPITDFVLSCDRKLLTRVQSTASLPPTDVSLFLASLESALSLLCHLLTLSSSLSLPPGALHSTLLESGPLSRDHPLPPSLLSLSLCSELPAVQSLSLRLLSLLCQCQAAVPVQVPFPLFSPLLLSLRAALGQILAPSSSCDVLSAGLEFAGSLAENEPALLEVLLAPSPATVPGGSPGLDALWAHLIESRPNGHASVLPLLHKLWHCSFLQRTGFSTLLRPTCRHLSSHQNFWRLLFRRSLDQSQSGSASSSDSRLAQALAVGVSELYTSRQLAETTGDFSSGPLGAFCPEALNLNSFCLQEDAAAASRAATSTPQAAEEGLQVPTFLFILVKMRSLGTWSALVKHARAVDPRLLALAQDAARQVLEIPAVKAIASQLADDAPHLRGSPGMDLRVLSELSRCFYQHARAGSPLPSAAFQEAFLHISHSPLLQDLVSDSKPAPFGDLRQALGLSSGGTDWPELRYCLEHTGLQQACAGSDHLTAGHVSCFHLLGNFVGMVAADPAAVQFVCSSFPDLPGKLLQNVCSVVSNVSTGAGGTELGAEQCRTSRQTDQTAEDLSKYLEAAALLWARAQEASAGRPVPHAQSSRVLASTAEAVKCLLNSAVAGSEWVPVSRALVALVHVLGSLTEAAEGGRQGEGLLELIPVLCRAAEAYPALSLTAMDLLKRSLPREGQDTALPLPSPDGMLNSLLAAFDEAESPGPALVFPILRPSLTRCNPWVLPKFAAWLQAGQVSPAVDAHVFSVVKAGQVQSSSAQRLIWAALAANARVTPFDNPETAVESMEAVLAGISGRVWSLLTVPEVLKKAPVAVDLDGLAELQQVTGFLSSCAEVGLAEHVSEFLEPSSRLLSFFASPPGFDAGDVFLSCTPRSRTDKRRNAAAPFVRSSKAWFGAAARGTSGDPCSPGAASGHSNEVACSLYQTTAHLLEYCGWVVVWAHSEGRLDQILARLPQVPELELLQDHSMALMEDICEQQQRTVFPDRMQAVVGVLLGVLERSLFLEAVLGGAMGFKPQPEREQRVVDYIHFLKEVAKENKFMEPQVAFTLHCCSSLLATE